MRHNSITRKNEYVIAMKEYVLLKTKKRNKKQSRSDKDVSAG